MSNKKFLPNRFSLSKDFLLIFLVIISAIIVLSVLTALNSYIYFTEENTTKLRKNSVFVERTISNSFTYVGNLMSYLQKEISNSNNLDPANISKKLMHEFLIDDSVKNIFSWTQFNWIDKEGKIYLSNYNGDILEISDFKNTRSYLTHTESDSGKLYFSSVDKEVPTGELVIPAGYGMKNSTGEYIGTIGMGFSLSILEDKIEKSLKDSNYEYVVFSEKGEVILSSDYFINTEKPVKQKIFGEKFGSDFKLDGIYFIKPVKLGDYPFYVSVGYNISVFNRLLIKEMFARVSAFILMGVILLALFLMLRKLLISPILYLARIAEFITIGRDVRISNDFEIRELNLLSRQLEKLIDYIKKLNQTESELRKSKNQIIEVNSKLAKTNHSLDVMVRERTRELEKALAVKSEILNNISHEIKTPIHGIVSISSGLVSSWGNISNEKRYNYVTKLSEASNRLSSLMNNLLDLSFITSGKMSFKFESSDLKDCLKKIISESKMFYIEDKELTIKLKTQKDKEYITLFDSNRIMQLLRNLFINAIKFAEKGVITAKLSKVEGNIIFELADEGIGIPDEEKDKIFEPFYQSSNTKTGAGGTGLGLAICREIIEAHKGKIWVSDNKPKGSKFIFTLPVINDDEEVEEVASLNSRAIINNMEIMLVDDEEIAHISFDLMLSDYKASIIHCYGGQEALSMLNTEKSNPHLILLDMMMPDMHGSEVYEEIRKNDKFKNIPIIIQTGKYPDFDFSDKKTILLNKPYKFEELIKEMVKIFHKI